MAENDATVRHAAAPAVAQPGSYMDWPAIFAGAVVASAIAFVFSSFGAALGFGVISPYEGEGMGATFFVIAVGLWMLWTTVSSFMAGGYISGRMRRRVDTASADEVGVRDGIHGLAVWGVSVIVGAMILSAAVGTTARVAETAVSATADVAGSAVSAVGQAAGSAGSAAAQMLPEDVQENPLEEAADALTSRTRTSAQEMKQVALRTLGKVMRDGELDPADRETLVNAVANNTSLTEEEVNARVDSAVQSVQEARQEAVEAAEAAEQQAKAAADAARFYGVVSAFVLAAALLIAGGAAYWAAGLGGRHRDEGRSFGSFGTWK